LDVTIKEGGGLKGNLTGGLRIVLWVEVLDHLFETGYVLNLQFPFDPALPKIVDGNPHLKVVGPTKGGKVLIIDPIVFPAATHEGT
jgi:hypothetical protein